MTEQQGEFADVSGGESLLVADDDPFIARLLEIELRAAGYDVRVASDGVEAFDLAQERSPDLVLADVMMPNMDGWELRARLPDEELLELDGARLAMIHDAGPSAGRLARMRRRFPEADAVVFGHSHLPLHERDGDFQIFNPGSPTERRRAPHHSMGVALAADGAIDFELIALD